MQMKFPLRVVKQNVAILGRDKASLSLKGKKNINECTLSEAGEPRTKKAFLEKIKSSQLEGKAWDVN